MPPNGTGKAYASFGEKKKMPGAKSGDYIAFRIADERGELMPVVAHLVEPDEHSAFPWAIWYHEGAPRGEPRKVPGNYADLAINAAIAETMIDLNEAGQALPSEFVERLPIVQ
jgi:hypothetical protein